MINEKQIGLEAGSTRYLEVEGPDPEHPVLFVHGVPTSCEDWVPFLEALDGKRRCLALDQIGLGASQSTPGLVHTVDALTDFVENFLDALSVRRFDVVTHDWGVTGMLAAARRPERAGRLIVINSVALFSDYRWHAVARIWRRRGAGELFNATSTKFAIRQVLRFATPTRGVPKRLADQIWPHWNRGMRHAVLELYRDADPAKLGELGRELGKLDGPALVLWGDRDPYIGSRFADRYGKVLDGRVEHLPQAGHWPWLDWPEVVERVADFLTPPQRPQ